MPEWLAGQPSGCHLWRRAALPGWRDSSHKLQLRAGCVLPDRQLKCCRSRLQRGQLLQRWFRAPNALLVRARVCLRPWRGGRERHAVRSGHVLHRRVRARGYVLYGGLFLRRGDGFPGLRLCTCVCSGVFVHARVFLFAPTCVCEYMREYVRLCVYFFARSQMWVYETTEGGGSIACTCVHDGCVFRALLLVCRVGKSSPRMLWDLCALCVKGALDCACGSPIVLHGRGGTLLGAVYMIRAIFGAILLLLAILL